MPARSWRQTRSAAKSLSVATFYRAGQTVDTPLTLHCGARTEATFDLNDSTWVTFYVADKTPIWIALTNVATTRVTLSQDVTASLITLKKGLRVDFNSLRADIYTVTSSGTIVDSTRSRMPFWGRSPTAEP